MYRPLLMAACLFIAGCTNNQLRRSTVGQAMTLNDIQHQQVMQNLASFAANEYALPRHVTLHDGTAQITDNGSIIGQVITGRFLNIGAQRTVVDQWSMLPVTNDVSLRVLKIAYRRALGSSENLYSDDLANDFAHEIKKQTYQLDDLRTLVANAQLKEQLEKQLKAIGGNATVDAQIPRTTHDQSYTTDELGNRIPRTNARTVIEHRPIAGITHASAAGVRNEFQRVISGNNIRIVWPDERITEDNLSVVELPLYRDADKNPIFRPATPLVIELRRQVYETNKDLEDIHPGWLCKSTNKHDIPRDVCYSAWAKDCGKTWFVWVEPSGRKEFEDFTLKILNFSGIIKEPTVSGATGVKFTPSGNNSAGLR
jgi:hypothetical protein